MSKAAAVPDHAGPAAARPAAPRSLNAESKVEAGLAMRLMRSGVLRPKLVIGGTGDPEEAAADRLADEATGEACCSSCAEGGSCNDTLRRTASTSVPRPPTTASPAVESGARAFGGGEPLAPDLKSLFAPRFGASVDHVRLQTGASAGRMAQSLGARAFALGSTVAFAPGQFQPATREGRRLIAHELAHVALGHGGVRRIEDADLYAREAYQSDREEERRAAEARHKAWAADVDVRAPKALSEQPTNIADERARIQYGQISQRAAILDAAIEKAGWLWLLLIGQMYRGPTLAEVRAAWAEATVASELLSQDLKAGGEIAPASRLAALDTFAAFYSRVSPLSAAIERAHEGVSKRIREEYEARLADWKRTDDIRKSDPGDGDPVSRRSMAIARAMAGPAPSPPDDMTPPPAISPLVAPATSRLLAADDFESWRKVSEDLRQIGNGLVTLVARTLPKTHEARTGLDYLEKLDTRLGEFEVSNQVVRRIPAIFYPEDRTVKETGPNGEPLTAPETIPWQFYLIHTGVTSHDKLAQAGGEWILVDLTSGKRFENRRKSSDFDAARVQQGDTVNPPLDMFDDLNSKIRFPKGRLWLQLPDRKHPTHLVVTDASWSLSDWLQAIALTLTLIAIGAAVIASGGAALPAAIAGYAALGATVASTAATLASLHEKSQHGALTSADVDAAIISIGLDLVSLLTMGAGRLVGSAAKLGITGERLLFLQRAVQIGTAVSLTGNVCQVLSATIGFVNAFRALDNDPTLSDKERSRRRGELIRQALLTGVLMYVSIRGDAKQLRSSGGRVEIDRIEGNVIVPREPIPHAQGESPHPGSRPDAEGEGRRPATDEAPHGTPPRTAGAVHSEVSPEVHDRAGEAAGGIRVGPQTHSVGMGGKGPRRDIYFCSDRCTTLRGQLEAMLAVLPGRGPIRRVRKGDRIVSAEMTHPEREIVADLLNRTKAVGKDLQSGKITEADAEKALQGISDEIARHSRASPLFSALMNTNVEDLVTHRADIQKKLRQDYDAQVTALEAQGERQAANRNVDRTGGVDGEPAPRSPVETDVLGGLDINAVAKPSTKAQPIKFDTGNFAHTYAEALVPGLPRGLAKEVQIRLPDGSMGRADRVGIQYDADGKAVGMTIHELKPNTPQQAALGKTQVDNYAAGVRANREVYVDGKRVEFAEGEPALTTSVTHYDQAQMTAVMRAVRGGRRIKMSTEERLKLEAEDEAIARQTFEAPATPTMPPVPVPASPVPNKVVAPRAQGAPPAPPTVIVDVQGGAAVRADTGAPTFLPSTVAATPNARGVLVEPGDYVPGYAKITTTDPGDLAMVRVLTQNLPRWPDAGGGRIGPQPTAWDWDPRLQFPAEGPVQVLTLPASPGRTPVPDAFFPPLGGLVEPGRQRLIPIAVGTASAQTDVTGLAPSTHPTMHGQADQIYLRRPFAIGSADAATTQSMANELSAWLRPGGFVELRVLRGGDAAFADALATAMPGSRSVEVPRAAIRSYAGDGQRPPNLTDEQWKILEAGGPDIRGEYGALGEGLFARIVRVYRGSGPPTASPSAGATPGGDAEALLRSGALRPKLSVGGTDDPEEAIADRLADEATSEACCASCADGGGCDETLRMKADGPDPRPASSMAGAAAARMLSNGDTLPPRLRSLFAPRFGDSVDDVRVQTDAGAGRMAQSIGARAFALGKTVVFAPGEFQPDTRAGRHLIAHELAHVALGHGGVRRQPKVQTAKGTDGTGAAGDFVIVPVGGTAQPLAAYFGLPERLPPSDWNALNAAARRRADTITAGVAPRAESELVKSEIIVSLNDLFQPQVKQSQSSGGDQWLRDVFGIADKGGTSIAMGTRIQEEILHTWINANPGILQESVTVALVDPEAKAQGRGALLMFTLRGLPLSTSSGLLTLGAVDKATGGKAAEIVKTIAGSLDALNGAIGKHETAKAMLAAAKRLVSQGHAKIAAQALDQIDAAMRKNVAGLGTVTAAPFSDLVSATKTELSTYLDGDFAAFRKADAAWRIANPRKKSGYEKQIDRVGNQMEEAKKLQESGSLLDAALSGYVIQGASYSATAPAMTNTVLGGAPEQERQLGQAYDAGLISYESWAEGVEKAERRGYIFGAITGALTIATFGLGLYIAPATLGGAILFGAGTGLVVSTVPMFASNWYTSSVDFADPTLQTWWKSGRYSGRDIAFAGLLGAGIGAALPIAGRVLRGLSGQGAKALAALEAGVVPEGVVARTVSKGIVELTIASEGVTIRVSQTGYQVIGRAGSNAAAVLEEGLWPAGLAGEAGAGTGSSPIMMAHPRFPTAVGFGERGWGVLSPRSAMPVQMGLWPENALMPWAAPQPAASVSPLLLDAAAGVPATAIAGSDSALVLAGANIPHGIPVAPSPLMLGAGPVPYGLLPAPLPTISYVGPMVPQTFEQSVTSQWGTQVGQRGTSMLPFAGEGAVWLRTPSGVWAPAYYPSRPGGVPSTSLVTYGADTPDFVFDAPGANRSAIVLPRPGGSYRGGRVWPMPTSDMFDPASGMTHGRGHLVPHAVTKPVGAGQVLSTSDPRNFVAHPRKYNEWIRNQLEQMLKREGATYTAHDVVGASPRVTTGGYIIPEAEVFVQYGAGGAPVRAWRFPLAANPAYYETLSGTFRDVIGQFEIRLADMPISPIRR